MLRNTALAAVALAALSGGAAAQGNAGRDLAATCANCHGTNGVSVGVIGSLAGRPKDDIARRMREFRSGGAGTVMPQLAKGYTDEQIEAVAAWFAAQRAP